MKIIEFIEGHRENWESLLTQKPYSLKIKHSEFCQGSFVMFNYDMIESDNSEQIVREARGLVLEIPDNQDLPVKIARKGFDRFYNYGEKYAAEIDWDSASATIKEDGTLIFISYYGGKWHVGTRQNFDLEDATMNSLHFKTFKELYDSVVAKYEDCVPGNFHKNLTYLFELCSRENKIVIDYPESKLFLLTAFNNDTGKEINYYRLKELNEILKVPMPQLHAMTWEEDYANLVESFGIEHEGLVIRDKFNNRLKMKSKLYFQLHKTVSNGAMDLEAMVGLLRKGEETEFLSYFPEYKKDFDCIGEQVKAAFLKISEIKRTANLEKNLPRKDFAMLHVQDKASGLWFKAYDGKLTDDLVSEISDEKFIQLFNIKL